MKTRYSFELMELDDSIVAVPVGKGAEQFRGVLKVNDTAATILKLLEKDTSECMIVEALLKEYSGDKEDIKKYVHDYIEKLRKERFIKIKE